MSKSFTLDDIRAAAEEKYGSTTIILGDMEVELVNVLRLPKERRDVILNLAKSADVDEEDVDVDETRETMLEGLRAACRTKEQGKALTEALGDDLPLVAEVFSRYTQGTQSGEASPSQS